MTKKNNDGENTSKSKKRSVTPGMKSVAKPKQASSTASRKPVKGMPVKARSSGFVVLGTVRRNDGRPAAGVLVRAYDLDLRKRKLLGKKTTGADGSFAIPYTAGKFSRTEKGNADLHVCVVNEKGDEVVFSELFNAPSEAVLDLIWPVEPKPERRSEFELLMQDILPLLSGQGKASADLPITELEEKDITFLAKETGQDAQHIVWLAQASNLARDASSPVETAQETQTQAKMPAPQVSNIPGEVFYGWFRQGLPTEPKLLFTRSAEELVESIITAFKAQIIPEQSSYIIKKIKKAIIHLSLENLLAPTEDSKPSLGDVLNTIPEKLPFDKQFIVASVLQDKNNPEIPLGEKLKTVGLEETQAIAVERTLAFQTFSQNFLPLIKTLQEDPEINSLQQLALKVNKENFTRKIIDKNAFPEGENPEDFAGRLYNNLFLTEPTAMLRNMLGDGKATPIEDATTRANVASFFSNLPETFNIKTTSVYDAFKYENAFEGIAPEFHEKIKTELKSLQRIAAISPAPEVVPVLLKARVTSALMVSDMPEKQFVQAFSAQLGKDGETIAMQVHANAINAQIRNEQALISLKEVKQGTGIAMVDKAMKNTIDEDKVFKDVLEQNNLSWDFLFGDSDFCECGECTSVYSAASYFVDLLQYLRNNNLDPDAKVTVKPDPKDISNTPLEKLFGRRPDLMCLQLTCKNTNTILPYVDLVNEVMENYVVFKKTVPFNVGEDETSGELLAQPHHTEKKAYELLHESVYPFTLPYHQPIDAARIYLNSLGTSRYDLINTFRSARDSQYVVEPLISSNSKTVLSPMAVDLEELYKNYLGNAVDAEYLGITEKEYVILTKEAFVSKEYWDRQSLVHTPEDYFIKIGAKQVHEYYGYGYGEKSLMLGMDESKEDGLTFVKKQFLKRTGLQYLDLVELLKTQCLNPSVPKEKALSIMETIQFSYRFLQTLVNHKAKTPKKKYEFVIKIIHLITTPQFIAGLNLSLGIDDPCNLEKVGVPLQEQDIEQWVYDYFERVGKIIVLDNGAKCIDGKLSRSSDNRLVDIGLKIEKCQIINEVTGLVVGSIDKTTGLVTVNQGQSGGDLTKIAFTGNKGEKGTFINMLGKYYLITTKIETCDLETVRLIHLDGSPLTVEEYDHIHRFIRLWDKSGWTINETDNAVISLSKTKEFGISPPLLHQLVAVKKLYEQTGLELIKLLTFWTNISTAGENSLYKRLFLTHNLLAIDPVFHADKNGLYLAGTTIEKILAHAPVLMAALNLKADDIDAIMQYERIGYLTLENVSKLYRYRLLSKLLGLKVTDFISVLPLFEDPFADADATLLFLEQWKRIEDAGFNHFQLNYIIQGQDDPKKPVALTKKTALQLAKTLCDGLNAIEEAHQDLKANSETNDPTDQARERQALATAELVKEKATILYDQVTVEKIIGVLEGTTIYSALGPVGVKDLLRPIPLKLLATIQDYELLQLDNYPLLRKKIKYNSTNGSLQVKGILTEFEEKGSSLFFTDDFIDLSGLVTQLTGSDVVSKYLWNKFTVSGRATITAPSTNAAGRQQEVIKEFNTLINGSTSLYDVPNFIDVTLSSATIELRDKNPGVTGNQLVLLNRLLLEDAYPLEIKKNQRLEFLVDDFQDLSSLVRKLMSTNRDPASPSLYLWNKFSGTSQDILNHVSPDALAQQNVVVKEFNILITGGTSISSNFNNTTFSVLTNALIAKNPTGDELILLNRLLLEDAYPKEIAKNKRVPFKTILNNLSPSLSLTNSLTNIKNQQTNLVNEVFSGAFAPSEIDFLREGDTNDLPIDAFNNIDKNTSPSKRLKFLEIFLPYLRKELSHRFIVNTLSTQAGLGNDVTDLLISEILKTGASSVPIYTLFEAINKPVYPNYNRWKGDLIPAAEGQYTFIVKDSYSKPLLSIDGNPVDFVAQESSQDQWWSDDQKLLAGQKYKVGLYRTNPENIYWKTATSSITSIPSTLLLSGWDGYLIPAAEGQYIFIVKGSTAKPDIKIDGQSVPFVAQAGLPDEWWSADQNLLAGKGYKLTLTGINLESIYWKTATSPITSIPSMVIMSGWDGYLIPSAEGQYNFIVKGSSAKPDLSLDDDPVGFTEQLNLPGEWWSEVQKLQAGKLYKLKLPEVNMECVYWKTATSSINSIPSTLLLSGYVEHNTIKAFAHLQKAALLVNGFKLSAEEIKYLSDNRIDFGNLDFNKIELKEFLRLEAYTRLRNSLPAAKINILEFFNWTHSPVSLTLNLAEKIEELSGWKRERIGQLIHKDHFNLLQPVLFRNETNLLKLQKALEVVNKISINIDLLFDWAKPTSDFETCFEIANNIQHVLRAQYNQEDWEQVVKPLSDKLRENQKNALIAYLLVKREVVEWGVMDADGLFEFFLIDVQMDACMETSRIVQAISSVQLFIQRCFLGLEKKHNDIPPNLNNEHIDILPNLLDRGRWDWMQRYRVWEANRKVFLYPENWIESNLRDDKSPFFKELESELLQKDINKQNVEDALKAYLYKVDEVANMEVIGLHIEMKIDKDGNTTNTPVKLHVFSRTRIAPYFFYYRYLDIPARNWYPWEKMQVDIPSYDVEDLREIFYYNPSYHYPNPDYKKIKGNGCYLTPIVWNKRLLIFFPQFMRKTRPKDDVAGSKSIRDISEDSTDSSKPIEYWEIKMAWSEYRNGKWTQKQLSKDAIYDIPALDGFWKAFNDASKAKVKADAANKETTVKLNSYNAKYGRWVNNGLSSSDPLDRPDRNIKDMANDELQEANANATAANTAKTNADNTLAPLLPPPPGSDISKYEFVPVMSDVDNLLGIKIYYDHDQPEKGIFEFNGSNITINLTDSYSGNNLIDVDRFHHKSSLIQSLQISNEVNNHSFRDGTTTTYTYFFNNTIRFYHSDSHKLLGIINSQQLEPFFKFYITNIPSDKDDVFGGYDDDANTLSPNIYHELKRPYSIYNWELFFHTPMMLADALSKSQQFEEAMKWYHYVFNPIADGETDKRFWQFSPFKDIDSKNILDHIFNKLKPNQKNDEINEWRSNPFKPHLVARSRPVAYMKWVVMKYIDNLVAWGDYLFRQDTIESINQATQLYVLAGHILGPRPQMIPKRGKIKPQTYLSLLGKWDAFSNAMVELEIVLPFSSQTQLPIGIGNGVVGLANVFGFASSTYFCIPNNPKLMGYWDTISDRLFKIRHCENIEGIFRKLPLFEPPIDPALLVKAAAQGLSIASVLNDLNTPMPNYRFYYLLQKALELCGELKSMGAAMLSAIEKKDNETISLIRAKHENSMLNLVMEIKKQQLEEAQKSLEGLQQNRKSPEHRMKYYLQLIGEDAGKVPGLDSDFSEIANAIETPIDESGLKLIKHEKEEMDKAGAAHDWQIQIGIVETLGSILNLIPQFDADGKPFGVGAGVTFGGLNIGNALQATARGLQVYATHLSYESSNAQRKGGFLRALQERVMQANAAGYEIKQIDKQILSQQIRIGIANLEITNHQKQIENAKEIEEFLINKYSNEELYSWMKGSLSTLYHQVYSMAFDLSKKAEKVYCFERGLTNSNFIQAGYWDAGYNGLLSGEQLYVGLKQLEAAYQEKRGYDYEITKHISLRQADPFALLQLKAASSCEFEIPEVLFDMDYPGHFKRRIKSVSISIPCIAGPYTSVNATLRLLNNKFRNSSIATNYPEKTDETDERFKTYNIPITAIATSSGQNDAGMFELNFKDERYLPFEGAGAISRWHLELPQIKQFDYNTISDVVLHVKYTASEGGDNLKGAARGSVITQLNEISQQLNQTGLHIPISLKHDMPNEWNLLLKNGIANISIDKSRLPYMVQAIGNPSVSVIFISKMKILRLRSELNPDVDINFDQILGIDLFKSEEINISIGSIFKLYVYKDGTTHPEVVTKDDVDNTELTSLDDLVMVVKYNF